MNLKISKSVFVFCLAVMIVLFVVFKVVAIFFGNNPLNNSRYAYLSYISVFPQGWAFFTKNSNDPLLYIYHYSDNEIQSAINRNFSVKNYFGISRHNRVMILQSSHLLKQIKIDSTKLKTIKALNVDELSDSIIKYNFSFDSVNVEKEKIPDFKGQYFFIYQELLPWSLIHKNPKYKSTFKIYPVNVIQK